jgi:shikimate kinase
MRSKLAPGVKIPTIFEIEGEDGFRRRESQTLDALTLEPDLVLCHRRRCRDPP